MNNLYDFVKLAVTNYSNAKCYKATQDYQRCSTDCESKLRRMAQACPNSGNGYTRPFQPTASFKSQPNQNLSVSRSLKD